MMKRLLSVAVLAAASCGPVGSAQALDLTAAVGRTGESSTTYRLGVQLDFGRNWLESRVGRLTGYWDAGYTFWESDAGPDNHSLSLAPVFVYEFGDEGGLTPFIELGVGIAGFGREVVEGNDLGGTFQFEDRLGAGLRFAGGHQLGLRAIHYSNAGLEDPNDGVESYSLFYRLAL